MLLVQSNYVALGCHIALGIISGLYALRSVENYPGTFGFVLRCGASGSALFILMLVNAISNTMSVKST